MVKAIFFDVDGTLVSFRTHTIPPSALAALHALREKGIKLFLATGRHRVMLRPVDRLFSFDGQVTLSGQYCFAGGRVLHSNPMPRDSVEELVAAARDGAFSCIFLEGEEVYLNCINDYTRQFISDLDRTIYQAVTFLTRENEGLLLDRAPHLKTTRWHPNFLDVLPPTGGKDKGVAALLAHYGIAPEEAMAFGDGENDLSMLMAVGVGVAMGSASDYVKERADYAAPTVDEDGVAAALKHFGLL